MKTHIIYASVALLAIAACTKENSTLQENGEITIEASIGTPTKVNYNGNATTFTSGDQISVYAWMGDATAVPATRVVNGVKNTFDGTNWTPEKQMLWKTVSDPHYFLGVFPTKEITDFTADPYTLNPEAYTASDLLIATNLTGVKATDGAVVLTFDHAMAKLNVNLKFRSQWATTPDVTSVTVKAKNTATVNYLTKTVTATGDASAVNIPAASAVASGYKKSYSGLQVPQTGVKEITVTIDGKDYVYTAQEDIPLEGGKYTTLGLNVGKDAITLGTISVVDWQEGTILPDGDALLANNHNGYDYVDMGEVTIDGVNKNLKWATCNVGAEKPWDYGGYFAWGETATKNNYTWSNYAFMQAGHANWEHITKYTYADEQKGGIWYNGSNFIGDGKKSLADGGYVDDAARQIWGGNWRIPTDDEWTALRKKDLYSWDWTSDYLNDGSHHAGWNVTRKDGTGPCSGNSIFLPAAGTWKEATLMNAGERGHYWSSTLSDVNNSDRARCVFIVATGKYRDAADRYFGLSVRPVLD